jgi:hypothetical protein
VTIEGLQSADPRKLDRAAVFGCIGQISAAVRTAGEPRSAAGMVLTRCAIAWRNGPTLTPSPSTIGSAKRWD